MRRALFMTVALAVLAGGALIAGRAFAPCSPEIALANEYVPGGQAACAAPTQMAAAETRPLAPAVTVTVRPISAASNGL